MIDMKETMKVADNNLMQDVFIADKTGTARVTLWEENVGKVEEGRSYTLTTKYLTMGGVAEVIAIEDIGTVALLPEEDSEHEVTLQNVTVIGVPHLDSHFS